MHWPWYQDQQCIKMIRHTIFEGQFSIYLISSRVSVSWRNTFFFISLFFLLCLFMPARGEIGFTQCMPFPPPVMKLIGLHAHYFFLQLYYYAYIYGIFSRYEISCMHPSLSNFADIALSKAPTGRCQ